jgi:3-phosphoshikimate 1-carboxyvinyltransferase
MREDQTVKPFDHNIEGDYSSAAFLFAAAAITRSTIEVRGLETSESIQGDKEILTVLREMGADVKVRNKSVGIQSANLQATETDASNYPDLVPPVAAMACYATGVTRIRNAGRLKGKESDRLATLTRELGKMGANIRETRDGLEVTGESNLKGARVSSCNDHRIAMACSVAALGAKGVTTVHGAECIAKSYPSFFDDLKILGADIVGR